MVKMCDMSINNWVKRYEVKGIAGLQTKPGRGRKRKQTKQSDETEGVINRLDIGQAH